MKGANQLTLRWEVALVYLDGPNEIIRVLVEKGGVRARSTDKAV